MYSSIAECRLMVNKAGTVALISDANITSVIDLADKQVREDIGNIVDVSLIPNTDPWTCEEWINELSRFKTNELVLVKLFGAKRSIEEVSDIQYWQSCYEKKLAFVMAGGVVGTGSTFTNLAKDGINPALGHGRYAGFIDNDALEDIRSEDTDE